MARPQAQVLIFISLLLGGLHVIRLMGLIGLMGLVGHDSYKSHKSYESHSLIGARNGARNRLVAGFGSDLQSLVVRKFHFDPALFAVVILVGRLVNDHVL